MHKYLYKRQPGTSENGVWIRCLFVVEYSRIGCVSVMHVLDMPVYTRVDNVRRLFGRAVRNA